MENICPTMINISRYDVYFYGQKVTSYLTSKRNCEDMIRIIRDIHENKTNYQSPRFKIVHVSDGQETIVYTIKDKKFFDNESIITN